MLRARRMLAMGMFGGGLSLPYTLDPSALPDGALPSPWVGSTFTVSSGVIVNAPSIGGNLLTDPDLEANYTAGKCDTLTPNGTPTLAQSADVHKGSKAQQFTAAAASNFLFFPGVAGLANRWYIAKSWGKRTAGTTATCRRVISQTGGVGVSYDPAIMDAAYTEKISAWMSKNTNNILLYPSREYGSSNFPTVITDDHGLYLATTASLFATVNAGSPDLTVKVDSAITSHLPDGLVARVDSATAPLNYLIAYKRLSPAQDFYEAGLAEVVNGVFAALITPAAITNVAGAWLELRMSGSTVSLWYNNAQVSTDKTTNVVTGNLHGIFNMGGGNSLNRFFVGA